MDVKEILAATEAEMNKAIEHCHIELAKVRTGRASTSLLDSIRVDYYGQAVPLSQIASVSTPDATMIIVQPWEKNMIQPIDRAIQQANIGLNPNNDGTVIRLPIPSLNEERRKELVKVAKRVAEESRVGVRNARREAIDSLKKAEKDEHMSEDMRKNGEADVQKLTDKFIAEVDKILHDKESDIISV
jgi:ribosome recycling factor